jgi:hypothetical protein
MGASLHFQEEKKRRSIRKPGKKGTGRYIIKSVEGHFDPDHV